MDTGKSMMIGGGVLAVIGFNVSGPTVPGFWWWMFIPCVFFFAGLVKWKRSKQG